MKFDVKVGAETKSVEFNPQKIAKTVTVSGRNYSLFLHAFFAFLRPVFRF